MFVAEIHGETSILVSRLWQMLPLGCVLAAGSFTTWQSVTGKLGKKPWENGGVMGFNGILWDIPSGNLLHSY